MFNQEKKIFESRIYDINIVKTDPETGKNYRLVCRLRANSEEQAQVFADRLNLVFNETAGGVTHIQLVDGYSGQSQTSGTFSLTFPGPVSNADPNYVFDWIEPVVSRNFLYKKEANARPFVNERSKKRRW